MAASGAKRTLAQRSFHNNGSANDRFSLKSQLTQLQCFKADADDYVR
jgi:hypothetical protein